MFVYKTVNKIQVELVHTVHPPLATPHCYFGMKPIKIVGIPRHCTLEPTLSYAISRIQLSDVYLIGDVKALYTYLNPYRGTTTSIVAKYSESRTKSSFFTRSDKFLVSKLPLKE